MTISQRPPLYWMPRVLGLLFAGFISLFALDVFGEGYGPLDTLVAFAIHMIPTAMVLVALALGWWREWLGALLFALLGLAYILMTGGDQHWSVYVFISGSLFLISALFAARWITKTPSRSAQ